RCRLSEAKQTRNAPSNPSAFGPLADMSGFAHPARRLSGHAAEHASEGGSALVADMQRHALHWFAPREKLARNRHAPDGQVVHGRLADPGPEMLCESSARHASDAGEVVKGP